MVKLQAARLACHHAVQLNTRVARAYVPAREDDSHTSLTWDSSERALAGEAFRVDGGPEMRLGLRLADLTLVMYQGEAEPARLRLDGRTMASAEDWIAGFGVDAEALKRQLHFELEDHPLLHDATFAWRGNEAGFRELAASYEQAATLLAEFRSATDGSPVRCWPHHFDIATLVNVPGGSIGAGMSPGDGSYPAPYYYVSPWPYPDAKRLPRLDAPGRWHTEGWVGAVMHAQVEPAVAREFVGRAFEVLRALRG